MDTTILIDLILPWSLAALMFGMGLSLRMADFLYLVQNFKTLFVGLSSILIITPALGWIIASYSSLEPIMAVGVVMVATCPGGTFSNLLTNYAKGNLALSISLTAVVTLIYLWLGPVIINLSLQYFMGSEADLSLPIIDTLLQIFTFTLAPIIAGMTVRKLLTKHHDRTAHFFRDAGALFITIIFLTLIYEQRHTLLSHLGSLLFPILLVNLAGIASGTMLSRFSGVSSKDGAAIIIEHTIRQEAMALYMAVSILGQPLLAIPLLTNSITGLLIGLSVVFFVRRKEKQLPSHT